MDRRIELTDEEIEINSRKLTRIAEAIRNGEKPLLSITYFVPDPLKPGGTYETLREAVRKIDPVSYLFRNEQMLRQTLNLLI